jgi:hypothetical protein
MNQDEMDNKNRKRGFERIMAEVSKYEHKGYFFQEIFDTDHRYEVLLTKGKSFQWFRKVETIRMWVESDGGLHIEVNE